MPRGGGQLQDLFDMMELQRNDQQAALTAILRVEAAVDQVHRCLLHPNGSRTGTDRDLDIRSDNTPDKRQDSSWGRGNFQKELSITPSTAEGRFSHPFGGQTSPDGRGSRSDIRMSDLARRASDAAGNMNAVGMGAVTAFRTTEFPNETRTRSLLPRYAAGAVEADMQLTEEDVDTALADWLRNRGAGTIMIEDVQQAQDSKGYDRFMIEPFSTMRVTHDVMVMIGLLIDICVTPVVLAWDLPSEGVLLILQIFMVCFWIWDIILGFSTGYLTHGNLEMRRGPVVKRYLRTAFPYDICPVTSDIIALVFLAVASGRKTRWTTMLKVLKLVRVFRFGRVARYMRTFDLFERAVQKKIGKVVPEVMKRLLSILIINHLLACTWYFIGKMTENDTNLSWLDERIGVETDVTYAQVSMLYQYTTAMHWSMTQMTPGSMQVFPMNTVERVFNFFCLVLGLCIFGVLISSMSAQMMQYDREQKDMNDKVTVLWQFLMQQNVSAHLRMSILQNVEQRMSAVSKTAILPSDVTSLTLLSGSLRRSLQVEICKPHLPHPLFRYWCEADLVSFQNFCCTAIEFASVTAGDNLFFSGNEAAASYTVMKGSLRYELKSSSVSGATEKTIVGPDILGMISEAAQWCKWRHVGDLVAEKTSEVIAIKPDKMGQCMEIAKLVWAVASPYAQTYVKCLQDASGEGGTTLSDLPMAATQFEGILPQLPLNTRLLMASAAIRMTTTSPYSMTSSTKKLGAQKLVEEVRGGSSSLLVNADGTLQRIVAVVLLRLHSSKNQVLAQLGEVSNGQIVADCKYPGLKLKDGMSPQDVLDKILQTVLSPIRKHTSVTVTTVKEEHRVSRRSDVCTRYFQMVCDADLTKDFEDISIEPAMRVGIPLKMARRRSISGSPFTFEESGSALAGSQSSPDGGPGLEIFAFKKDFTSDDYVLYAWLDQVEIDYLKTPIGRAGLKSALEKETVSEEHLEKAAKLFDLAHEPSEEGEKEKLEDSTPFRDPSEDGDEDVHCEVQSGKGELLI